MQAEFWNQRFAEDEPVYGTEPNVFLSTQLERIRSGGHVLCLGEGEGRNAVWLASQGMSVTATDYAEVALERAKALAALRGVEIEAVHADLATFEFPEARLDAIVSIFVHLPEDLRRSVHRRAMRALRPGGVFIAEYFSRDQLAFGTGGPKNPTMLYTLDDIREDFSSGQVRFELLEQVQDELQEGRYHQGCASLIRIVARRVA